MDLLSAVVELFGSGLMGETIKAATGKAPAGWKRLTVLLNDTTTRKKDLSAEVFARGLFAIHRPMWGTSCYIGSQWQVSHIPSGCRIGDPHETKAAAIKMIARIRGLAKWRTCDISPDGKSPPKGMTMPQAQRIKRLIYKSPP